MTHCRNKNECLVLPSSPQHHVQHEVITTGNCTASICMLLRVQSSTSAAARKLTGRNESVTRPNDYYPYVADEVNSTRGNSYVEGG